MTSRALDPLSSRAPLAAYDEQADALLAAWRAGDPSALALVRSRHPALLDETVRWLPRAVSDDEARAMPFGPADARLVIARAYDFADCGHLADLVESCARAASPVARFEAAVDAIVDGDLPALDAALAADPDLVRARSTRVTWFDPPRHRATLLHYVAANGVEAFRQRTPPAIVDVTRRLLQAGADPDALADMYGGRCTTLALLASSQPPAAAGHQVALIDVLVEFGASVHGGGAGTWTSPLHAALAFGFEPAALALERRGATVDLAAAAALGRIDAVRAGLAEASAEARHRALALAAQFGRAAIVALLIEAGEPPDRFNPEGLHAHATPLHHAALAGHLDTVRVLVERGARLDIEDRIYHATPLAWAEHQDRHDTAAWLRSRM